MCWSELKMCKIRPLKPFLRYSLKSLSVRSFHCQPLINQKHARKPLTSTSVVDQNSRKTNKMIKVINGERTSLNIAGFNLSFDLDKTSENKPVITISINECLPAVEETIKYEEIDYDLPKKIINARKNNKSTSNTALENRSTDKMSQMLEPDDVVMLETGQAGDIRKTLKICKTSHVVNDLSQSQKDDDAVKCGMIPKIEPDEAVKTANFKTRQAIKAMARSSQATGELKAANSCEPGEEQDPCQPDNTVRPLKAENVSEPGEEQDPRRPDNTDRAIKTAYFFEPGEEQDPRRPDNTVRPVEAENVIEPGEEQDPRRPDNTIGAVKTENFFEPGEEQDPRRPNNTDRPVEAAYFFELREEQDPRRPDKTDRPIKTEYFLEPGEKQDHRRPDITDRPVEAAYFFEPCEEQNPSRSGDTDRPLEAAYFFEPSEEQDPRRSGDTDRPVEAAYFFETNFAEDQEFPRTDNTVQAVKAGHFCEAGEDQEVRRLDEKKGSCDCNTVRNKILQKLEQTKEYIDGVKSKIWLDHDYIRHELFQSYPRKQMNTGPPPHREGQHICLEDHCARPSQRSKLMSYATKNFTTISMRCKSKNAENKVKKNSLLAKMFHKLNTKSATSPKVSVIGAGQVGITISAFLLQQRLTRNLTIVDVRDDWVKAEALDLSHAMCFMDNPKITACSNMEDTNDSQYIIITAGVRPAGKSRLEIAQDTADILKDLVPSLVKLSPNATYLVVSNPSDVMAWVTHKVGKLPPERCISVGCHLDTARFKYYISKRLKVPPSAVQGFIIGEHGASAVPVWSSVMVGGVRLQKLHPEIGGPNDPENWSEVHEEVIAAGNEVSKTKGYTNWAIAMAVCDILGAMTENSGRILSVGTEVKNINCIEDPVYLSLPCMLNPHGVTKIVRLPLTDYETCKLLQSAEILTQAQCCIEL